jgi:hypothetical protein
LGLRRRRVEASNAVADAQLKDVLSAKDVTTRRNARD